MPGLTLVVTDQDSIDGCDFAEAQRLLLHRPDYAAHSISGGPGIHVGWVGYPGYPVRIFECADYLIYLEGRVYNNTLPSVEKSLIRVVEEALEPGRNDSAVERFIQANEGSYLVVAIRPSSRDILLFTDAFCRLPLFYGAHTRRFVVSREAKFVHALNPERAFDRVGCAQVIAFGLPLGERTVLERVKSFPDAALLRLQVHERLQWRLSRVYRWTLEEEDRRPVREQATGFANLFLTACKNWGSHLDSKGNIISLSGGHDSRAVVAGMARMGIDVSAVSYRDPNGKREHEVEYAHQLANALNVKWDCINLPRPPESAYEQLAWLKDGMNWSSMGYILRYLEAIVARWGPEWTYLSGDGGDDCLKVTAGNLKFRSLADVIDHVLANETTLPPDRAEAILGLPKGKLREELQAVFESYPERDLARRLKHFKIFERGRRCYFEGEDRTRAYLWQDSPFYSLSLFQYSMRVPDSQKQHNAFCRAALMALSPAAAATPVTPRGHAPASWKYLLYHHMKDVVLNMPPPMLRLIQRVTGRAEGTYVIPEPFSAYLREQLNRDTPLSQLLNPDEVSAGLRDVNAHSFFCFWTVAMLEKAYRSRIG